MYGDESIYNLIPVPYQVKVRSPTRSVKKGEQKQNELTGSTFGKCKPGFGCYCLRHCHSSVWATLKRYEPLF